MTIRGNATSEEEDEAADASRRRRQEGWRISSTYRAGGGDASGAISTERWGSFDLSWIF